MPSAPELSRAQRNLWDLITAPEGVASTGPEAIERARRLVRSDERLDAVERLDIYANMYFYRLRDCLAEDFPKVVAMAGGAAFHNLITDYLLAHPSSCWSLRELGRALPEFIARHELAGTHPFLADLALLEWARDDIFDETDATDPAPLSRADIAALNPGQLDSLELSVIPAFRLLDLGWDAAQAWRQIERSGEAAPPAGINSAAAVDHGHFEDLPPAGAAPPPRTQTRIRVWRRAGRVYHRVIEGDEHACLEALTRGATLARLGEIVFESVTGGAGVLGVTAERARQQAAIRRLGTLVESWLEESLLVRLSASARTAS